MQKIVARAFSKRVGFIGMGNMGLPMTDNLKKAGFDVVGYDISADVKKAATEKGTKMADSIKEAVTDVDFVITCLPKTEHVETVLKQPDGIFDSAKQGAMICDVSTISPVASAEFHDEAQKRGMTFLDTPMSGGITGAIAGSLTFMVGGSEKQFEESKEVLKGMGINFFHCGKPGNGEVAKLCNNLMLGINMISCAEGLAIGEKLGMDPKVLQSICAVSTSRSWPMDTYNPVPGNTPASPANRNYDGGFGVSLVKKDLALALEAAKAGNADTHMTETAIEYYTQLEKKGFGHKDLGFVYPYIMKNRKM